MKLIELTLEQVGYVRRGRSRHRPRNDQKLFGGAYPFIQTAEVKEANLYITKHSQTYNDFGLAQSKLWDKGTLLITIAANIAESAILTYPACFPDSIVGFIADKSKTSEQFIKYYIDYLKLEMQSASLGTTQDNLSVDKLLTFKFRIPHKDIQIKIESVLGNLDEAIFTNKRRIEVLEEIVSSLYKEWFVNFKFPDFEKVKIVDSGHPDFGMIPQRWSVKTLGDICFVNKSSFKPSELPETIQYIDIASVGTGVLEPLAIIARNEAPGRAKRKLAEGDTIWSCVRPNRRSFAYISQPEENWVASTGLAVLTSKFKTSAFIYCHTTNQTFTSYLVNQAQGAAYPAVKAEDFLNAPVLVPDENTVAVFDKLVTPILELKNILISANEKYSRTRDLLLPKLISGELEVSEISNTKIVTLALNKAIAAASERIHL
jgi:type I restriction enzyme S subunit